MRLLLFHADSFRFDAREDASPEDGATAGDGAAAAGSDGPATAGELDGCLVAFVTLETGDSAALDAVIADARDEVAATADQLRTGPVALYPTAGLSDRPADAALADEALAGLAAGLAGDYDVYRVPTASDAAFELAAKGHPFAEQSRRVTAGDPSAGPDAARPERVIAFPDGSTRPVEAVAGHESHPGEESGVSETLAALVEAIRTEAGSDGGRRRLETAGREARFVTTSGDGDPLVLTPRGTFVRDAIVEYVRKQAVSAGAVPVETGTAGTAASRSASSGSDGATNASRDGTAAGPNPEVLPASIGRPAVRPAVLELLAELEPPADGHRSVYQQSRASNPAGRPDERDERWFAAPTIPELWTLAEDLASARDVLLERAALTRRVGTALGLDAVPLLRVTAAFADDHGPWIDSFVERFGAPVLLERWPDRRPWTAELAFLTVFDGQPVETGSVRLDRNSPDHLGVSGGPGCDVALCCAPVGSAERAVLTVAARASQREPPGLPTWLSPTQVRFVPTDPDECRETCGTLAADLDAAGVRVDVDDRHRTVGERLDRADADWVPYHVVVGRKEAEGERVSVYDRAAEREAELTLDALRDRVLADADGSPQKGQYLRRSLRDRPTVGGRGSC